MSWLADGPILVGGIPSSETLWLGSTCHVLASTCRELGSFFYFTAHAGLTSYNTRR